MSKELTEQWWNGTLNGGIYYLLLRDGTTVKDKTVYIVGEKQFRWHYSSFDFVKEVLAPVPSYDEWAELQEASDGLSKTMFKSLMDRFVKADEERERLEEQLKEANEVIENMKLCMDDKYDYDCVAEDVDIYLEKWGLR